MTNTLRAALACAALASACTTPPAAAPDAPAATPSAQPVAIALGDLLGVLHTVDLQVEDQSATMIFDTGGGVTAITPALAETIGCAPWGQVTGFRLTGEQLTGQRCTGVALALGGAALGAHDIGVFDLSGLLPPQAPRIDGLFSLDALGNARFTLELGASRLTLETPDSFAARIAGAAEIPVRLTRQAGGASLTVMAQVPSPQGDLWMQLDAGSDAPLQLAPSSAAALGLDPAQQSQPALLTLATNNGSPLTHHTTARTRDMIIDGNIGLPVLKAWTITLDLAAERMWITQAPPH